MFSRIYTEDIDAVKMFIGECKDCLKEFERDILKLEVDAENNKLLDDIFKHIHRIKCESSFLGLSCITRLSYEIELILNAIRDRKIFVDNELTDNILFFVDFSRDYIASLQEAIAENVQENSLYLEFGTEQHKKQEYENLILIYQGYKYRDDINSLLKKDADTECDAPASEAFNKNFSVGLKEQFLLENTEYIEIIENDLLIRQDTNNDDKEAVKEIFRAVHTIKGGTGIYLSALPPQSPEHSGLKKFSDVVHTFESLLALIRDKGHKFDNKLIDLSYSVIDYLRSFVNAVATDEQIDLQNDGILNALNAHIAQLQSGVTALPNPPAAPRQEPVKTDKADDTKQKNSMTQSIRVNQEKIDKMMNMISELLIAKNSFMHLSSRLSSEYDLPEMSKEVKQVGASINRISDELQNAIMSIRMVEVRTVFQKMPRVVRDIAQSAGKKIEVHMEGEDTEIDKTIIESISDPLVHLIRNAADHGVESPEERVVKGKSETGRIILRAYN
jgi:two-component system chemotaxis sensor kinase CheA